MIVGVGSDIVAVPRLEQAIATHGPRFLERVFTPAEIEYAGALRRAAESFAARFAAKEAAFKALGVGWPKRGVSWLDAEVERDRSGAPSLVLSGRLGAIAAERGVTRALVTLSHTEALAFATVILEGEGSPSHGARDQGIGSESGAPPRCFPGDTGVSHWLAACAEGCVAPGR